MTERAYTAAELVALLTLPERIERLERQVAELAGSNSKGVRATYVPFSQKTLLTKKEAAATLSLSMGSLDILIARGEIEVRQFGKRILVPGTELDRIAKRDVVKLWPTKKDGKTTRR